MKAIWLVVLALAAQASPAAAQCASYWCYGPRPHAYGYNHGVYYGGPPSRSPCGYYGCSGYLPRGERRVPTYRNYDWSWGGGDRGYLGGRGGGWGGEW